MNLSLYIAGRYLFSKKSHQVINIISAVAIAGIALATAAMVCTLSVFNGFQSIVAAQFSAFDADIKITAASGKVITTDAPEITDVTQLPQIEKQSFSIEGKAMVGYGGNQTMATIKGVDEHFASLTDIRNALYGPGDFILNDGINSYAVLGGGLTGILNCGVMFTTPLSVYVPNTQGNLNMTIPARNFKKGELLSSGLVFAVNQPQYDANYILTSVGFARNIFRREANEATSMEIRVTDNASVEKLKERIESILGSEFVVLDRY
jgi:lipoprotein-releasing system permease protein